MYKEKIHFEIEINAAPEKVFDFLTDPHNIPLVLPGLIENSNIPPLPVKVGTKFNFKYQMFGVVINGETVIDKVERPSAYDFTISGGVDSKWVERMTGKNGGTHFTLDVGYNSPQSWIDKIKLDVVQKMNQGNVEHYLRNIKTLLEMQS